MVGDEVNAKIAEVVVYASMVDAEVYSEIAAGVVGGSNIWGHCW